MKTDRLRVMSDLEIIEWARDSALPMDRVLEILCDIHINIARIDPPIEWLRRPAASSVNRTLHS
jgi:hypothetical protein